MDKIRIIHVDDHEITRQGLLYILGSDPRFSVIGEAATGSKALELIGLQNPDVVIVDLILPDMAGVELCLRISKGSPNIHVIILSAYFDRELVLSCLRAGAKGYLIKDVERLNLPEQIISVIQGHTVFDPRVSEILADYIQSNEQRNSLLSLREIDVIRSISMGKSNREIALQLHLSESTVKGYVQQIFSKLNVHSRIEAVSMARKYRLY